MEEQDELRQAKHFKFIQIYLSYCLMKGSKFNIIYCHFMLLVRYSCLSNSAYKETRQVLINITEVFAIIVPNS